MKVVLNFRFQLIVPCDHNDAVVKKSLYVDSLSPLQLREHPHWVEIMIVPDEFLILSNPFLVWKLQLRELVLLEKHLFFS